jgi:hypothetical protein
MNNPIHPGAGKGLAGAAGQKNLSAHCHGGATFLHEATQAEGHEVRYILPYEAIAAEVKALSCGEPEGREAIQLFRNDEPTRSGGGG